MNRQSSLVNALLSLIESERRQRKVGLSMSLVIALLKYSRLQGHRVARPAKKTAVPTGELFAVSPHNYRTLHGERSKRMVQPHRYLHEAFKGKISNLQVCRLEEVAKLAVSSGLPSTAQTLCDMLVGCTERYQTYELSSLVYFRYGHTNRAIELLQRAGTKFGMAVVLDNFSRHLLRFRFSEALTPDHLQLVELMERFFSLSAQGRIEMRLARLHLFLALRFRQQADQDKAALHCNCALDLYPSFNGFALRSAIYGAEHKLNAAQRASLDAIEALPLPLVSQTSDARKKIVVLCGLGEGFLSVSEDGRIMLPGGHNNLGELVDLSHFEIMLVWAQQLARLGDRIDHVDVVVNTMSEPDCQANDLAIAESFLRERNIVVINHPAAVRNSARHHLSHKLAHAREIIVPLTKRFHSEASFAYVTACGVSCPFLARPVGSHSGASLSLVRSETDYLTFRSDLAVAEFYATTYVETSHSDGLYRKVRVYWLDGEVLPEHYYINENWNVHSESSNALMSQNPWMLSEAQKFLEEYDPAQLLTIMRDIADVLGLNVFMADFGLTERSELVLFEANACMSAIRVDELAVEGRHILPFVAGIRASFNQLVSRYCGRKPGY